MQTRVASLLFASLCLLIAGTALAKKSRFTIKNCTDKEIFYEYFDGDDELRNKPKFRRARGIGFVAAGKAKQLTCEVDSGKRRCWAMLGRVGNLQRVKNNRTLYATFVNSRRTTTNQTGCTDERGVTLSKRGRFLTLAGGDRAKMEPNGDHERARWRIEPLKPGSNTVTIKNASNDRYMSARGSSDDFVKVDRTHPRSAERFEQITHSGGRVSFKANNGKYLREVRGFLKASAASADDDAARFVIKDR